MTSRLVLGSHDLVTTIARSVADQPGSVSVGTDDQHLVTTLREDDISATKLDPSAGDDLTEFSPDIVFIVEPTQAANLAVARAARRTHPDAYLLAYTGDDAIDHGDALSSVVNSALDPGREVASHVMNRIGDEGGRMRQLRQVLRDIDRLAVVTHDNPDPDAIASGIALAEVAQATGCEVDVCYYGEITHQENRAFVNVLNLELRNFDPDEDISEFDGLALVDHTRPGVNDQLPEDTPIDIVIDHHPPRSPVDARFVDLRSAVGATSTLLVGYLDQFGIELDETVATALLFGIHVDTDSFTREISQEDFEAASKLVSTANLGVLERIESPSISPVTFGTIASAIRNRRVEGQVLLSCVGQLSDRDALAQAADRLLRLDGVATTMVYGISDGTIFVSARSQGTDLDLGETLRDAFGQIGSAGGHVDMAGAQITLGVLDAVEEREESLTEIVEEIIAHRFLDAVEANTPHPETGVYAAEPDDSVEYLVPESELEADESKIDGE
jgi:nanoRNase/pAp phosphatase (c-di-AMP/oligoRNAs hydrolase)